MRGRIWPRHVPTLLGFTYLPMTPRAGNLTRASLPFVCPGSANVAAPQSLGLTSGEIAHRLKPLSAPLRYVPAFHLGLVGTYG